MRILLTGAFGQLGFALSKVLDKVSYHEIIRTGRSIPFGQKGMVLDIQNKVHLKEVVKSTEPEVIINLAAMTNVDACEQYPELAKEINIAGLQHICDVFDGKIIHLSTDYVFDGKSGPYGEDDQTCPISVYGKTKLASERILLDHNPDHLVIRGNVLYDYSTLSKASFLNWVVSSLIEDKEINVVEDQINNPTWARSMADVINLCISNDLNGIVHWGDADHVNRFDFAKMIAERFSLNTRLIKPILTKELGQTAPRPLQSGLMTNKIVKILDVIPPSISDCLEEISI